MQGRKLTFIGGVPIPILVEVVSHSVREYKAITGFWNRGYASALIWLYKMLIQKCTPSCAVYSVLCPVCCSPSKASVNKLWWWPTLNTFHFVFALDDCPFSFNLLVHSLTALCVTLSWCEISLRCQVLIPVVICPLASPHPLAMNTKLNSARFPGKGSPWQTIHDLHSLFLICQQYWLIRMRNLESFTLWPWNFPTVKKVGVSPGILRNSVEIVAYLN